MKSYFILFLLVISIGLSAQTYSLQAGFGVAGITDDLIDNGPTGNIGLEAAFKRGTRFAIFGHIGLQRTDFTNRSVVAVPCYFPFGIKTVSFTNSETYQIERTEAYLGSGLRYTLGRFQFAGSIRGAVRLHNKLTYTDELNLNRQGTEPTFFTTVLRPGDRFQQNARTGTVDYDRNIHLQGVFGLGFQVTERLSLGVEYVNTLVPYQLVRYTLNYCENCEDLEEPVAERRVDAGVAAFRLTGSIRL